MKTRSLVSAVLAASVLAAVAPAVSAGAHGPIESEHIFYENGQMVGQIIRYCDGHYWQWGDLIQIDNEFIYYGCG
ncbi:hypothetical protein [Brevundimonas sp.]|jgi:hypothetical protein|uniref:hypothetical protein n=1 Tax=Brevundimonas sp. TaxID=1871086 RepID=UPI002E11BC4D|nr:hypothetical protein [Brevundimonas sp.]